MRVAVEIAPDDKDWTWVLERTCPECRFDVRSFELADTAGLIRENAASWWEVLRRSSHALRQRPRSDRWSPLEYGAHVRAVFRLYHVRLLLMLDEDDPLYPNWDQDASAVADRYNEQDPVVVADELIAAAADLAAEFERLDDDQWARRGRRSDGASFTVATFARYLIHDPVHHLFDVRG
jgi:hypothetical protein